MRGPLTTAQGTRHEILPGIWLDSRHALWLADERVLVVADLHWGYAAAHRARGNLLPLWGDEDIAARLRSLARDFPALEMVWLGDCVHAAEGAAAAEAFLAAPPVAITVLCGNHDKRWRRASQRSLQRGRFFLHHGDAAIDVPEGSIEIIGHHHPAVAWADGAGGNLKLPACVATAERLILPAFSPWAGGTDWSTSATDATLWAVAPKRIFAVPGRRRIAV